MGARLMPITEGSSVIPLEKAITLIGRHPDCDAVLAENQKVSRRHCCIAQVEDRLIIRDLGSMNGIRVNGESIVESDLVHGDAITIGDEEFFLETFPGKRASPNSKDARTAEKPGLPSTAKPRPIPAKPRPIPNVIPVATPVKRKPIVTPADISQEFPVAIPEEFEDVLDAGDSDNADDQLVEIVEDLAEVPKRKADVDQMKFINDVSDDPNSKDGVLKLDSGEIQLSDFNPDDHPKK